MDSLDLTNFITAESLQKAFTMQVTAVVLLTLLVKDLGGGRFDRYLKIAAAGVALWIQVAVYLGGLCLTYTLLGLNGGAVAVAAMTLVEKIKAKTPPSAPETK